MISVDTNVLIRVFVNDESDLAQIQLVRDVIKTYRRIYVSQIVQAETAWVLKSIFSFGKKEIVTVLEHLMENQTFVLEGATLFEQGLALYRTENIDFSDALILCNSRHQESILLTFDKKLLKQTGTQLPQLNHQ